MTIYFITGNKGKLEEAKSILSDVECLDIDLPEIQDLDAHNVIQAKLAEALKTQTGEFIIEDISLYCEALNGLPGPLIKWFLKTVGNDGIYKMVSAFGNSRVEVKAIIGYADGKGGTQYFEGVVKGSIVAPRGEGFGWDPIFQPDGYDKTFGEMSAEEKNKISMRKIALEKLREYLNNK